MRFEVVCVVLRIVNKKEDVERAVKNIQKNYVFRLCCGVDKNDKFQGFISGYSEPRYEIKLETFNPKDEKPYRMWVKKMSSSCYSDAFKDCSKQVRLLPKGYKESKAANGKFYRLPMYLQKRERMQRLSDAVVITR